MADLTAIVDDTVRRERGRIVGGLLRLCGSLDAAEEAFQEAALSALEVWGDEIPANPGAWLMTAAKNRARDARRRRAVREAKAPLLAEDDMDPRETIDSVSDDYLRLILTCCHPELSSDNQIALTLKMVAGFSTEEIARAFVCSEATVSQRILRAKQTLASKPALFGAPERDELGVRVAPALGVVYSMFNEGHTGRSGALMRLDLQAEALRLGRLLCDLVPGEAEAFALVAIMAFNAARAHTRVDADGVPILLSAQDRSSWNKELLREGLMALARARTLGGRGPYALQAEIAAVHVTAATWEGTDWAAISALYSSLQAVAPSPIVALNRAVALSMYQGPAAGLRALEDLESPLSDYHLFYATRAELRERLGQDPRPDLLKALALVTNEGERRLLERRLNPSVAQP
ncbi:MAG TPA: sigma-70 family RNA polymerase sigma factor [Polyangiaceae bacterium]|nr:sigma-70 family RNA polymerase sigma factor [Polyangiaceae bacterium]